MRNKIFVIIIAAIFVGIFIYSPLHSILMANGIIEYENAGNKITVDKVYDEDAFLSDFFNDIEEGKRTIVDTYTNHLPGYLSITSTVKNFKTSLSEDFTQYLQETGNKLAKENIKKYKESLKESE